MPGPGAAEPDSVELLDLGAGRQLARLGQYVVDRPYPAAVEAPGDAQAWSAADLRFDRLTASDGRWTGVGDVPESWHATFDGICFELRPAPSGQVGLFLEQSEPWQWIRRAIRAAAQEPPPAVLNLFAYTGGSTLVAAAEGASVTHVDAVRSTVAWARRNAGLSGLAAAPIRWIVDDAVAFTRREARRGRRYDGLILDPPSYGHGPGGEGWALEEHLPELLDAGLAVLDPVAGFVVLTAHAEGLGPAELGAVLADAFRRSGRERVARQVATAPLDLRAASGRIAPAGVAARWPGG